ncbi:MAG: hypothetical protein P4M00_24730 [Azospirillaceae bacterium]|nr:hypothetical protein [Azospirillaceae bacterium]
MTTASYITPRTTLQKVILLGGCCALFAGCSTLGLSGPPPKTVAGRACPKVGFVPDATQITQFRDGPGRDLTDIVARAGLLDFRGQCDYDDEGVTVSFNLFIGAERGPAFKGTEPAHLPYFVAITAPDGEIVAKQEFSAAIDFKDAARGGTAESLEQRIPLPKGKDARAYTVMAGFQLSRDQLAYNRLVGDKGPK